MIRPAHLIFLFLVLGPLPKPAAGMVPGLDFGPFFSSDRTVQGFDRRRAAGPFFEQQSAEDGKQVMALRPAFCRIRDPQSGRDLTDILWPLGMVKDFEGERMWRFFTVFGHDFDAEAEASRWRVMALPIAFAGRDAQGEGYFALFPVGGTLHEFLWQDKIAFALFPLYARHEKKDVVGHHILFPFISWAQGEQVSRLKIFPLYARAEDRRLGKVNTSVLWPFWTSVGYPEGEPGEGGFILFPFYGQGRKGDQQMWTVLPPFFRYSRSPEQRNLNCPWPLVQWGSGEVDKLYIWPLWGQSSSEHVDSRFLLWPLVTTERVRRGEQVRRRVSVQPIVHYQSVCRTAEDAAQASPEVLTRYLKLWPLCSYERRGEEARTRALALWPVRNMAGVERNLAPFWSLYTRTRVGDEKEDELLWGLARYRRDGEASRYLSVFPLFKTGRSESGEGEREWSLLYGLLGYERQGLRKRYRLLYFLKFGDKL